MPCWRSVLVDGDHDQVVCIFDSGCVHRLGAGVLQTDDLTQVKDDESHSTIVLFISPKPGQICSKILKVNNLKSCR